MLDHLMVFSLGAIIAPIIVMVALFYAVMFFARVAWRVVSWRAD